MVGKKAAITACQSKKKSDVACWSREVAKSFGSLLKSIAAAAARAEEAAAASGGAPGGTPGDFFFSQFSEDLENTGCSNSGIFFGITAGSSSSIAVKSFLLAVSGNYKNPDLWTAEGSPEDSYSQADVWRKVDIEVVHLKGTFSGAGKYVLE